MLKRIRHKIREFLAMPPIGTWEKWLKLHGVDVRGRVNVYGKPIIITWGNPTIVFENSVTLDSDAIHNAAGIVHPCSIEVTGNGKLYVGKNTGMSGVLICCQKSVQIGSHVGLGANVTIYDNDSHPINPYERIVGSHSVETSRPVQIDDYAWIGANAMILKGVHIGRGAVIGAGSVVTKDVPELTVYAGNPAKFVKNIEITEEQRKEIFGK